MEKAKLDDIEFASMLIGGACHDHEHPGVNNAYLVETRDDIAIKYNDISVLENHHIASSFALFSHEKYNILQNFDKTEYKKMRSKLIGNILSTDMSKHFADQGKFKSRV
jgi:3'5'-cyclic nucleotide phosphodiesterase